MNRPCALITGASSGIGRELAFCLAKKGFNLVLSGRNSERLQEVAEALHAEIVEADLANELERKSLIAKLHEKEPELLINCAGFGLYGDALSLTVEEQLSIVDVNVRATLEMTLEAVRGWIAKGRRGIVLNVSSAAGELPCPGMSVYGASKAFLTQLSQALHAEVKSYGISVLVSCPGMVATEFASRAAKKKLKKQPLGVMSSKEAANEIWKQIQQKQIKKVFDWKYRWGLRLLHLFVPKTLTQKILWNQIKKRI